MPIYEYRCRDCGHVTEVLESTERAAEHACGKCGGPHLEKILSTFGVGGAHLEDSATGSCGSGCCPTGTCPFA